jgi:beta-phosphoglucomutase-like phosphatase (HAD superfamily)
MNQSGVYLEITGREVLLTQKLRVDPGSRVVLEDSFTGVRAAKAAGMKVIAVPNRYTAEQVFSNAGLVAPSLKAVDLRLIDSCY